MNVTGVAVGGRGRTATIHYSLPAVAQVSLGVYDVTGRRVATLADGPQEAGSHQASWNAGPLSPGVYFLRLRANGMSATRTLLIAR